jgi:hypothetical protein
MSGAEMSRARKKKHKILLGKLKGNDGNERADRGIIFREILTT